MKMFLSIRYLLLFGILTITNGSINLRSNQLASRLWDLAKVSQRNTGEISNLLRKHIIDDKNKLEDLDFLNPESSPSTTEESSWNRFENLAEGNLASFRYRRDTGSGITTQLPKYKEFSLNGTENDNEAFVHWSGKNKSDSIFVLTRQKSRKTNQVISSSVWRSVDYGANYSRVKVPPGSIITYFYISPVNYKKAIFVDVAKRTLYITTDELNTITPSVLTFQPDIILLHPTKEDWVLGYWFIERKLYYSSDLGKTWTLLHAGVSSRIFWGVSGIDDEDTIHLEISIRGNAHYKKCNITKCIKADIDKKLGSFVPVTLLVVKEYVFMEKRIGDKTEMYVSYKRQEFKRAYFPPDVTPRDYIIVNADEGQVFIAVSHTNGVSLYLSDTTGQFYIPTMKNVRHIILPGIFVIDLHEVKSMKGTYLANQRTTGKAEYFTMISYDKGGFWHKIPVPNKEKKNCGSGCSLHLHLDMGSVSAPGILSEKKAPGLILAHGNIGNRLSLVNMSVYVSRDGGWTWNNTGLMGLYRFNILDQGGVLTAILESASGTTNKVFYSIDQGTTWHNTSFLSSDQMIQVDGVLNEPDINSLLLSVYGHDPRKEGWRLITINFTTVLPQKCAKTDFEMWTPQDSNEDNCTLGQSLRFERRKQFSVCSYGQDYEQPINHTVCPCTAEDYECDYGYEQQSSGKCKKASWFNPQSLVIECVEGKNYNQSSGYRKVGSDKCEGGVSKKGSVYSPTLHVCPIVAPYGLSLHTDKNVVATKKSIMFELSQSGGSESSTVYTWNFGDNIVSNITGLSKSYQVPHQYSKYGIYNVTVIATNTNGSTGTFISIRVEDEVTRLHMDIPWATVTGKDTVFEVLGDNHEKVAEYGHTLFVWTFGNEGENVNAKLTWEKSVTNNYNKTGLYHGSVETINSVSSIYKQFTIQVFDVVNTTTVQLYFANNADHYNLSNNLQLRVLFVRILQRQLIEVLGVQNERFVIHADKEQVFTVHVTFFPGGKNRVGIQELAEKLIEAVNTKTMSVVFFGTGYNGISDLEQSLMITKAVQLAAAPAKHDSQHNGPNYKPMYIAIPVLLAIIAVTLLVVVYYRKRFRDVKRYTLLRNRSDDDNHLLGDDDDDDPPLDLNPDFGVDRNYHDDQLDLGTGSHLVMVTGDRISDDD